MRARPVTLLLALPLVLSALAVAATNDEVYLTPSGKKYHRLSCRTVDPKKARKVTREEAEKAGLEACKLCKP